MSSTHHPHASQAGVVQVNGCNRIYQFMKLSNKTPSWMIFFWTHESFTLSHGKLKMWLLTPSAQCALGIQTPNFLDKYFWQTAIVEKTPTTSFICDFPFEQINNFSFWDNYLNINLDQNRLFWTWLTLFYCDLEYRMEPEITVIWNNQLY